MTQICVQKYVWSSIESKRGFAEEGIKEKLSQLSLQKQFNIFKEAYGKEYSSSEEESEEFSAFVGITRPKRKSSRKSTQKPERKFSGNKSSKPERKSSRGSILKPERKSSRENSLRPERKSSREKSPRPERKSSRENSPRPEGKSSFFRSLMSDHRKSGQKDRSLKPRMLDPDSGSDSEHPGSRRPERRRSADPTPSRNRSNRRNFPNSLPPDWRPAPFGTLHYIEPVRTRMWRMLGFFHS
ncbi:unnamed protein product [Bemisia tabaci]|uniref:Uncharacterized protein n=1 Tax=Bemisia tabaci TaxID=7038 RepID=A0A9P0AES0_BEMTA|nr:unnamed protein product [Bemisia tabaci]